MVSGLWPEWHGDYDSKVYWIEAGEVRRHAKAMKYICHSIFIML